MSLKVFNFEYYICMHWYVIYTKPRQEQRALLNLEQQGFECYLPLIKVEKFHQRKLLLVAEPLFARYLFIRLDVNKSGKSWSPIRSTKGVSRLVAFGNEPLRVEDDLIQQLRAQHDVLVKQPQRLFEPGEHLLVTEGPFSGIEAVYQMSDGENRAMVLIELLSKPVKVTLAPSSLTKLT